MSLYIYLGSSGPHLAARVCVGRDRDQAITLPQSQKASE